MTRNDFMKLAQDEIEIIAGHYRNRLMNLVEQAWAEGKRNAEIEGITEIVRAALEQTRGGPKEADE